MKNKIRFIVILILLIFVLIGVVYIFKDDLEKKDFIVVYSSGYSSSGGTRTLDITYVVENNEIISCDGTYTVDMTDGKTVEECDLEKLKDGKYIAFEQLITSISKGQKLSDESTNLPGYYRYDIIFKDK